MKWLILKIWILALFACNNSTDNKLVKEDFMQFNDTSIDSLTRASYFKAITKSYNKSDRKYFSQNLGLAGYEFVLNNTQEFASYFNDSAYYTNQDLTTWADIVILKLSISGKEGKYGQSMADDYINKLKENCKDCTATEKETINKFEIILKRKWNEFLIRID